MKKFLAAFLALAMIASLLPAALADGGLEPITLTVFRGDPGDQPDENNKIYKLIEEEFGIKFEFEFLAGDLDETLGLKIANEDYPDLFDGGNSADLIINNGALINLLDYISPEKTPRLWAHIEPQKARIIEKDGDGIEVKVSKLTPGKKYTYKISGVSVKDAGSFKTISGTFVARDR